MYIGALCSTSHENYEDKSPVSGKIGECHHSRPPDSLQCLCCCSISLEKIVSHHDLPAQFLENIP